MRASYQTLTPPEKRRTDWRRACTALALVLAASGMLTSAAHAQDSVNDYRLPPAPTPTPSGGPVPAGPADPDNPIATRPSPAPSTAPPLITPAPAPTARPSERATEAPTPRAATTPRPTATPRAEPSATPTATASEATPSETPLETPSAAPLVAVPSATPEPAPAAETDQNSAWLYWAGGAAALIAFAGIAFALRRRVARDDAIEPEEVTYEPALAPQPRPAPRPVAAPPPPPAPAAVPADGLTLQFEPGAMRMSLVYATLKYRIDLTAAEAKYPLRVLGDIIGAHSSLDSRAQLAPDPAELVILHDVAIPPPEGPLSLTGELRIPLEVIRVIRKGQSVFFVPLARFCVIGADGVEVRRVFTVGGPGASPTEPLSPILLNGPGQISTLATREIEAARSLALDPVRVAG